MDENKESDIGLMEKLAMIADALDEVFPDGTSSIFFSLDDEDFKKVQKHFRDVDRNHKKFNIDISGTEMLFISNELLTDESNISSGTPF